MTSAGDRHLERLSSDRWDHIPRLESIARAFGYDGPKLEYQELVEWLSEKATVLVPIDAECRIKGRKFFDEIST
jgi:hypothetical protein